jgi:hypothetical protein
MIAGGGRCREWAKKIQQSVGGDMIQIIPNPARFPGAGSANLFIGPVRTRSGQVISEGFKEHVAVRVGDAIYDRITGPMGMHIDDYKRLFDWGDDLVFDRVIK